MKTLPNVLVAIFLCLATGCATKMVEGWAVKKAVAAGYRPNPDMHGVLRAPENTTLLGMTASQAAWQYEKIPYFLANLWDYGVIPAATVGAGVYAADQINADDHSSDDHSAVDGDRIEINGDNNTVSIDRSTDNSD